MKSRSVRACSMYSSYSSSLRLSNQFYSSNSSSTLLAVSSSLSSFRSAQTHHVFSSTIVRHHHIHHLQAVLSKRNQQQRMFQHHFQVQCKAASTDQAKASTSTAEQNHEPVRKTNDSDASIKSPLVGDGEGSSEVRTAYPFQEIESKWQNYWEHNKTFSTGMIDGIDTSKPKFYALDMFPYPSGAGLHVGHPEGYTATDIISRYKRMKGYNVLHPMGWDAFGLPAEQYALQTGTHPETTTRKNIGRFRSQLKSLGFSYDWDREIATTDPKYYKWTQWIFLKLLERDLAYQAEVPVNWCPALGTVLANEEVIDGKSERGGHPVVRKAMKQWMLRITAYADRLIDDLEGLDWSENVKDMQRNWIGRSQGASIKFSICSSDGVLSDREIELYTTRPDTICGATFVVMAPEHALVSEITSESQRKSVADYVDASSKKSDFERTQLQKQKTGVNTGAFALNPATGEPIPILIADYVLGGYGSGAIMAVPAHDERDFEFAEKFGLNVREVVKDASSDSKLPYTGSGKLINSNFESTGINLDGLEVDDAKVATIRWLEDKQLGNAKVNYKLRDWLFARQRYWGEPFPVVYSKETNECIGVPEETLPLVLPDMESFQPSGTGESPLANNKEWVETVVPGTNVEAVRDTNTMPQWAGSCWYYLRFIDPWNDDALVGRDAERYWMPVDLYVGGAEHTVLHLLYARFWHKVLYDIGVVSTKEPFQRLVNQGMILGEVEYTGYQSTDGKWISATDVGSREDIVAVKVGAQDVKDTGNGYVLKEDNKVLLSARAHKMSKSRGNVINPDDIVSSFGGDSLRLYEMFMGPLRDTKTWSTRGVEGVYRFLGRAWRLFTSVPLVESEPSREQMKALHECIKKVSLETEEMRYNTAIAAMMEYVNAATKWDSRPRKAMEPFVCLLSPYAPHIAEELWERLGHSQSLAYQTWPAYDESFLLDSTTKIPVQINGKMRGLVEVPIGSSEGYVFETASALDSVSKYLLGKDIKKCIYVENKILNVIVSK